MSKPSAQPPSNAAEDFSIEIDPGLIEEALAAVDRRRDGGSAPAETEVVGLEEEPDPSEAVRAAEEETRRARVRLQEQAEQIRRLERDLARAVEGRAALEKQARDARQAHSELFAEFERYRARVRKDVDEAERRGEDKILRPVIDVYDNVERAWLHAVSDPTQILGGLQMIVEQFKRLLVRLGFERVDADRGILFDPAQHEAVLHVHSDEVLPGTIVDEVQAGFRLRGRLFRPARVTVSAPPPGLDE